MLKENRKEDIFFAVFSIYIFNSCKYLNEASFHAGNLLNPASSKHFLLILELCGRLAFVGNAVDGTGFTFIFISACLNISQAKSYHEHIPSFVA